ncbi:MAG TPA: NADH-quinone oxidoreductase subunit C [Chloroflexota bacterium]|nr:NADH-quinone oxidoreductase subunit C [Chloroflexota bacterium]
MVGPVEAAEALRRDFGGDVLDVVHFRGEVSVLVRRENIVPIATYCREELEYNFLSDLTCVDWLGREPRFDVVYHLTSLVSWTRLRLKVQTEEDEAVPTVSGVWGAANWAEREVYDLFGIGFEGHPDLTRLLMPSGWIGHPLRKDYRQSEIALPRPKTDKVLETQ